MYPERLQSPVNHTSEHDFRIELLNEKTHASLLVANLKQELIQSLPRLSSKDVLKITEALQDIEWFINEKYKEIEDRAWNVGRN